MAIVTDPDTLSRFDVVFGTTAQKVSIYPIGSSQRITADDTFTAATTDICTVGSASTDWVVGDRVYVTTTGTLPAPLAVDTEYFVGDLANPTADDFKLYTTYEAAFTTGTAVDITTTGTGTHTIHTSTVVNAVVASGSTQNITKQGNWHSTVTTGDVVCIQNTTNAGHYYVNTVAGATITLTDIDDGTAGAATTALVENASTAIDSVNDVNATADTITITTHGYNDGDEVVYEDGGGTSIGGLEDGGVYYVIRTDANTIQLAISYANAIAATPTAINLSDGVGAAHALRERLLVSVYSNGASASEQINGNTTSGDGTGDVLDGITLQAMYSYSKEEWKDDSIANDEFTPSDNTDNEGNLDADSYTNDLIRFEFPFEAITSEQFEIGGGAAHDAWTWFNDYSRKKVRTGGWADKNNTSSNDLERYTGIVTLGALDSDTQVYYQQLNVVNTPTNFTFLGPVNEPIRIWLDTDQNGTADTDEDKTTFLKLFARKKARTYAGSEIADIGVSTIQTIVNRFPLSHVTDAAIAETDGAILGKAPWKNITTHESGTDGSVVTANNNFTSAGAFFTAFHIITVTIVAGGTGYAVDDTLDITPGTATEVEQPVLTVSGVNSGAITSLTITNAGGWSALGDMDFTANSLVNISSSGSGATIDFRVAKINRGDTLTITAGSTDDTNNGSYTVLSVTSDTVLTIADDADFTTSWSQADTGLTYTVDTTVIASDTSTQTTVHQDYTTGATGTDGIIATGTSGVGTLTDANGGNNGSIPFTGVTAGDLVKVTSSERVLIDKTITTAGSSYVLDDLLTISGGTATTSAVLRVKGVDGSGGVTAVAIQNIGDDYTVVPSNPVSVTGGSGSGAQFNVTIDGRYNGIYTVLDSSTTGASDPTDTVLYVDTTDVQGDFPGTTENSISYQVFKPGMYLQWKQFDIDNQSPTSYAFTLNTGTSFDTIARTGGTWNTTTMGAGTILTVANAENTSNNGVYTVRSTTTSTVTLLATTANETTDRLGVSNASDTTAIITLFNGFNRTIGTDLQGTAAVFGFNWKIDGNDATLSQVFEKVQHQLRQTSDIDNTGANKRGDITDLLMSFATPTGTGLNMFIDNLASSDINNATFNDAAGTGRNFPFTASGNLSFNKNLTDDATSKYWLFFTNDDAGDNLARDYGTKDAIIVNDASGTPVAIQGDVNGSGNHTGVTRTPDSAGTVLIPFTYDYDGNTQRGSASSATDAPVTLVAIGLSLAQFVVSTGTITRATGITISAVAALERNYSNT